MTLLMNYQLTFEFISFGFYTYFTKLILFIMSQFQQFFLFSPRVLDQAYLVTPSLLDQILDFVNLSVFLLLAFIYNLSIRTSQQLAYNVTHLFQLTSLLFANCFESIFYQTKKNENLEKYLKFPQKFMHIVSL